jgi:hypothetical protein
MSGQLHVAAALPQGEEPPVLNININKQNFTKFVTNNTLPVINGEFLGLRIDCLQPAFCLAHSSRLKMEAVRFSETWVNFYRAARHYVSEGSTLHSYRCDNLKSDNQLN